MLSAVLCRIYKDDPGSGLRPARHAAVGESNCGFSIPPGKRTVRFLVGGVVTTTSS